LPLLQSETTCKTKTFAGGDVQTACYQTIEALQMASYEILLFVGEVPRREKLTELLGVFLQQTG